MANVLSISSQVVYGHVGNSTAAFVLQRMGHHVLSLPTILLSNRPGYAAIAGDRSDPQKLDRMLEALAGNGWLGTVDAILTGYLPSPGHAALSARWIENIKRLNPDAIYLCDPIIGDEPAGIYVEEAAASAIRDLLAPRADILTPNCFELGWLSGQTIRDTAAAISAARCLAASAVLVTSAPASEPGSLANILTDGPQVFATASKRREVHAHGTGDFFASLFLAHVLNGLSRPTALRAATAAIGLVLDECAGRGELPLIETQERWALRDPPPESLAPLSEIAHP